MAQSSTARAWARGGTIFAATVMFIVGIFQILEGIAAIAHSQFFVVANFNNYTYNLSTRSWGWIHLCMGIVVGLTGLFLYTGVTWARVIGIILAVLSATANFFFLPYYPLWSLLIIALDIFVIWALASAGGERGMRSMEATGGFGGEAPQAGDRWATTNQPAGRHWSGETSQKEGARGGQGGQAGQGAGGGQGQGQGSQGEGASMGRQSRPGSYPQNPPESQR
jgi:hypothetical protein